MLVKSSAHWLRGFRAFATLSLVSGAKPSSPNAILASALREITSESMVIPNSRLIPRLVLRLSGSFYFRSI
jgi:hypothetical protein